MGRVFEAGQALTYPLRLHVMIDVELHRARRFGQDFSLVTLTIENFRSLRANGQAALLIVVAEKIETFCRLVDLIFYIGDGGFSVLRPGETRESAAQFAHDTQKALNNSTWLAGGSQPCLAFVADTITYLASNS